MNNSPKYKTNGEYLVKGLHSPSIYRVKILDTTKTCYRVQFEYASKAYYTKIEDFDYDNQLVEILYEFDIRELIKNISSTY